MPRLYFPKEHEENVKFLTSPLGNAHPAVFPEYRDLMLFAAMVGKQKERRRERIGNGGEVDSEYIASRNYNKDGVVYLMGLLEFQDPEVLKGGAEGCWRLFEDYCAGGMDVIGEWIQESEVADEISERIIREIMDVARDSKKRTVVVVKPKRKLRV